VRRDPDLIRQILLSAESTPANKPPVLKVPGVDQDVLYEHLELLIEQGLLEGSVLLSSAGYGPRIFKVHITRMTAGGHDFLDSVRNDQVWKKVLKRVAEKGGSASIEILVMLGKQYAKELFFGPGTSDT
jgi:hypothetical protein